MTNRLDPVQESLLARGMVFQNIRLLPVERPFLSSCPLEGKNSIERQRSFKQQQFLGEAKEPSQEGRRAGLSGNQKQPCSEHRVGF